MSKPFKIVIALIAGLILARQLIPLIKLIYYFPLNDFSVYLDGAKATLEGKNPHTLWFFDRYNYPPAATLFFIPFILLSANVSEYLFTAISIISLWFTFTYILSSMIVKPNWSVKLLLFALAIKLYPVKLTLVLGQINLLILFLVIASFYFQKKKPYLAGVLLGLATAIKLTPILMIPYFLIKKNYRLIISFITFIIFINIIAIGVFGLDLTRYYYTQVFPDLNSRVTETTLNATYMNQSITALLGRVGIFGITNSLTRYLVSGFSMLFLILNRKKYSDMQFYSSLLIISTVFLPVFVWQHHYVFVIPLLLSLVINRQFVLALIFYGFFNLYFRDSGQAVTAHPLISTHFLSLTALLIVTSLVFGRLNHKKSHPVQPS